MSDWYTTTSEFRAILKWQAKHEKEYFRDKALVLLDPSKQTEAEMLDALLSTLKVAGHTKTVVKYNVATDLERAMVKRATDAAMAQYWVRRSEK